MPGQNHVHRRGIDWRICLFGVFVTLQNNSLIWTRHLCRWMSANFDLYSALMAIDQWGFFSVSHLLWYGVRYRLNWSSPRTHDTNTYCRAIGNGAVTTCFYVLGLSSEHPTLNLPDCEANALIDFATAAVQTDGGQTDRQSDRQTERQAGRQTDRNQYTPKFRLRRVYKLF